MGMHFGLIAVRANVDQLREAIGEAWPKLEIVEASDTLSGYTALWQWKESKEVFVSAAAWTPDNPGRHVYALRQDGAWAELLDFSYVLPADQDALALLSAKFGTALAFIVESAAGCAFFYCHESGSLRRKIENTGEAVLIEGAPLSEESDIDVQAYYMSETESLMRALGLTPLEEVPPSAQFQAIAVVDHTDYSGLAAEVAANVPAVSSGAVRKPWWKFW